MHTDLDAGAKNIKYILAGDGAGTFFVINDKTGDIHAMKRLDREEKAEYTLTAQAINRDTDEPLEPPSEFIIKVQDINDNAPEFLNTPYHATVLEMSDVGTSVTRVTATDADDPVYGNSAKLVYSILEGQPYFSIEPHTAIIRTALPNMDREAREQYLVVIQAKDMGGHMGGLSGTTTVTITLTDVNDNPPKFSQSLYHFSIPEDITLSDAVGKVKANDRDIGENASEKHSSLSLLQPLDFETKKSYTLKVEAVNVHIDPHFISRGPFKDTATVKIAVEDSDEPPVFSSPTYLLEVHENSAINSVIGQVTARDPDVSASPIRYSIDRHTDLERQFNINSDDGKITLAKALDRETDPWHNITVIATEIRNYSQISRSSVTIKVLDINDNAPEFASEYEAFLCENGKPGQVIQTVSAIDKDDPKNGHFFFYSLVPEISNNPNFTIKNNEDNSVSVLAKHNGFRRQKQEMYFLPIIVSDNGNPPMSSTHTLTIRVCGCSSEGVVQSCNVEAYILPIGLSMGALIAILACIILLLVIVVLFVTLRRHKNEPLIIKDDEDVRENIIRYDDEGGGEEDTEAFDIATLQNPDGINGFLPRKDIKPDLQFMPRQGQHPAPNGVDVDEFINVRLHEADNDPTAPPYDSIQIYGCCLHHIANLNEIRNLIATLLSFELSEEVIVVLFVTLRRHKNEPLIIKDDEDVRENIIRYDDEGGGEEDTEAFDIATLQNPDGINGFLPRKDIKPDLQFMPRQGQHPAPNGVDVDEFINVRLHEADNDPTAPPYDSIQIYGYEGRGSVAGSLSSLESASSDSDQNFDYLREWGPRFKRLGELYSVGESDMET
ncbi:UNVERIFIED_CONTAM: hypothetical protein FKN15_063926 [Acipenser sinensis]